LVWGNYNRGGKPVYEKPLSMAKNPTVTAMRHGEEGWPSGQPSSGNDGLNTSSEIPRTGKRVEVCIGGKSARSAKANVS
jgi:hypothetical protein